MHSETFSSDHPEERITLCDGLVDSHLELMAPTDLESSDEGLLDALAAASVAVDTLHPRKE